MMQDHLKINNLIIKIKNTISSSIKDSQYMFIKLKWNLEKHFYIEEKVIFYIYSSSQQEEIQNLNKILNEHKDILLLIKKIDNNFNKSQALFDNLKDILSIHARFEDEIFYPRLEEELPQDQKQLILERCKIFF